MIMNDDINHYIPSVLNPRSVRKNTGDSTLLTQNSIVSRCSLSLKRPGTPLTTKPRNDNKENSKNPINALKPPTPQKSTKTIEQDVGGSLGFSAIADLVDINSRHLDSSPLSFEDLFREANNNKENTVEDKIQERNEDLISLSSATELEDVKSVESDKTTLYKFCENNKDIKTLDKPLVSLSFGFRNCDKVDVSTISTNIKKISVEHKNNDVFVDCDIIEASQVSSSLESYDENMNHQIANPLKRSETSLVTVNLEIKKKKLLTEDATENSKILILNTDAIEKVSHVIVQPPNYKIVKRQIPNKSKLKKKSVTPRKNGKRLHKSCNYLNQISIDNFFKKKVDVVSLSDSTVSLEYANNGSLSQSKDVINEDGQEMSKNFGVSVDYKTQNEVQKSRNEYNLSARSSLSPKRYIPPRGSEMSSKLAIATKMKTSTSEAHSSPLPRNRTGSSSSQRRNVESLHFELPSKSRTTSNSVAKTVPQHKIVAGTHFAVDAFSYGEIPNVKHYFLSHFHSDHYGGLKKSFNKLLYCSKITADLCISRLGVNSSCITVLKQDEPVRIEGVEVTAVDANHCPGALMLVFTLCNGKTILHTGDFRACPAMESYPIFWNRDCHTIYLDTTYCNPRYDFPTQEESLDMALYLLRQKKVDLEKDGKKFSTVLIVCGTYTIGKEKFFLGMAKRVGCSIWACPEKNKVLQAVEGRSFNSVPPQSCQLHVVSMRDLTVDKLGSYLESLHGTFTEVIAFKPSGWENGKNSTVKDGRVTIHGIPYSEHSSFSEMIRFVNFLKPKQVIPTVDISGGVKAVQKYFPCPLIHKEDSHSQSKVTDYFSIHNRAQLSAVTWLVTTSVYTTEHNCLLLPG